MPPKKLATFRFGAVDRRRLIKLSEKKEWSYSAVMREALKIFAEMEGIKIK